MLKINRTKLILGAISAIGACSPALADFNYVDFSSTAGLTLVGSAVQSSSSVLLTESDRAMSGALWYTDLKQNLVQGFEAEMKIRVVNKNGGGADGFALVFQNSSPTALGGNGGGLGYAQNPVYGQAGIANSLAVEVDLWDNTGQWADLSSSHISIQSRGLLENSPDLSASLGATNIADLSDGAAHTIRIVYGGGIMSVYTDDAPSPSLSIALDIGSILSLDNGLGWVGVTSSTGSRVDSETHELMGLRFTGTPIPAPGAFALFGAGALLAAPRRRR